MNFAVKMSHVKLYFSYRNRLHLRCLFQNICDRFEDILGFRRVLSDSTETVHFHKISAPGN